MQRLVSVEWVLYLLKTGNEDIIHWLTHQFDLSDSNTINHLSSLRRYLLDCNPFVYFNLKSYQKINSKNLNDSPPKHLSLLSCSIECLFEFPRSNILHLQIMKIISEIKPANKKLLKFLVVDCKWIAKILKVAKANNPAAGNMGHCVRFLNWLNGEGRLTFPQPAFVSPYELGVLDMEQKRREEEEQTDVERKLGKETKDIIVKLLSEDEEGLKTLKEWKEWEETELVKINKKEQTPICPLPRSFINYF